MNAAILPFPHPISIPHSALSTPHSHGSALPPRRTGKIARLPKAKRDQINRMLDENVPYSTIIAQLGEAGKDLNPQNISNWAQGGYQDYLRHQDLLEALKDQVEFAQDLLAQVPDSGALFHALRLMAGLQLSRVLFETGQQLAETDPAAYARLVRTICSLSSAERQYCQDRNRQAQAQPAPAKPIDYFRPLTERETQLIRAKLDEMCGYPAEPAPAIKADQASGVEVRFQRAGQGGFQPPVPAPSVSTAIKAHQTSTQNTAAATPLGSDAQNLEFTVQGSAFEVQGSPAQPELAAAQPAASPIKPDQASSGVEAAVPAAGEGGFQLPIPVLLEFNPIKVDQPCTNSTIDPFTSAGPDVSTSEFKVQSSAFEVQGSSLQHPAT